MIDSRVLLPMNTNVLRALVFLRLTSNLIVLFVFINLSVSLSCRLLIFHALLNSTELILEAAEDVVDYGICCHPLLPNNDSDYLSMLLLVAWLDFLSLQATRASDLSRDCFHHLNHIPLEVHLMTGRTVVILISC